MIAADKQLIQSQLKQSSLVVREKELNFFTQNFENLGTQSALLAGFAFGALNNGVGDDAHFAMSFAFHITTTASMVCNLWCVCNCTCISMFGPGLALRGPDGSMQRAVDGMQDERVDVYKFFAYGVLFIHLATISFVWCRETGDGFHAWLDGVIVTIFMTISMYRLWMYSNRIWLRFDRGAEEHKLQTSILDEEGNTLNIPKTGGAGAAYTSQQQASMFSGGTSLPRPTNVNANQSGGSSAADGGTHGGANATMEQMQMQMQMMQGMLMQQMQQQHQPQAGSGVASSDASSNMNLQMLAMMQNMQNMQNSRQSGASNQDSGTTTPKRRSSFSGWTATVTDKAISKRKDAVRRMSKGNAGSPSPKAAV